MLILCLFWGYLGRYFWGLPEYKFETQLVYKQKPIDNVLSCSEHKFIQRSVLRNKDEQWLVRGQATAGIELRGGNVNKLFMLTIYLLFNMFKL